MKYNLNVLTQNETQNKDGNLQVPKIEESQS